ncbi:MAG: hypothetical protein V1743_04185 [Nanoarchaeota archaeon]
MSGKNTAKVVRFLLRSTEKRGHNINQVAKSLRISVGSSFQVLKELKKKGMAVSEQIGNATYYSLDFENPETVKLCELLLLEEKRQLKGYAKVYAADIQQFSHATLIILFGSILTRKEFNDVDVLFVTDKVKEVNDFCLDLSKVRAKPIVPLILKKEDLLHELRDRNGAVVSIIKEGVVLKGESALIEVAKHAK